jgi:predicted ATPase
LKIKSLHIKNFKSIVDLTINEPNPFTVFVGPNGSGKSNIFEALEYSMECFKYPQLEIDFKGEKMQLIGNPKLREVAGLFGGIQNVKNRNSSKIDTINVTLLTELSKFFLEYQPPTSPMSPIVVYDQNYFDISKSFLRLIQPQNRHNFTDDVKLNPSCDNLEKVLKRVLKNAQKREEIFEWLDLFIPEFDKIEVRKNRDPELILFQKHYKKPFERELISDGTYNIIALLTAVYQSDEPQFLCIEEPENGLHPFVQKELVNFFRWACEEYGHYIWLNTHSQSIVSQLTTDEIITVNKRNGETKIQQHKNTNLHGFKVDEAWLNNVLGGGNLWS